MLATLPDNRECIPADKGRVRCRTRPARRQDLTYKREARLLHKLLAHTMEGHVLTMLKATRYQSRGFLKGQRQRHEEMQKAYETWRRL
jgi:hypothetical protein